MSASIYHISRVWYQKANCKELAESSFTFAFKGKKPLTAANILIALK